MGAVETVDELESKADDVRSGERVRIQPSGYLLELSLDWIVLRASENIHHLLHDSHVTLIDEPAGRFVHSQALHDLRNLFSRLSGTTGVGRAYAVRLTDDHDLFDIAFQLVDGRVLLEAVPTARSFGEYFGTVGGLTAGLTNDRGQALLDGAARRMRALTGYDGVMLSCGEHRAQSSRGAFSAAADLSDFPILVADTQTEGVEIFPREVEETSVHWALMRSLDIDQARRLKARNVRALMRARFTVGGVSCEFCCESRTPRKPSFELHAAAELFAQMFAMQLRIDAGV